MSVFTIVVLGLLTGMAAGSEAEADPQQQVRAAERAFAKTMADRDHTAFVAFLADEAVFFAPNRALTGKHEVAAAWRAFFEGPKAPFSWAPERVEVLASGGLALSSGPVKDPDGRRVGTFNSVWRREPDGRWQIVFDNGCPPCDCQDAAQPD